MPKIKHTTICVICGKDIYDDTEVCKECHTNEFISFWGDPVLDEEAMSLEFAGNYPYHYQYWEEYKKNKGKE